MGVDHVDQSFDGASLHGDGAAGAASAAGSASAATSAPAAAFAIAARFAPLALAAGVVVLQIVYPLVPQGAPRDRLTIAIVLCFAAASLTHALLTRGASFALALFATTTLGGFVVEVVGVHTGVPFGEYRYMGTLGTEVLGVPLLVALAWTMMAYPSYVVSEIVGGGVLRRAVVGGWALASWDLFLDPQMVQAGHWQWASVSWELGGIPVTNYVAWFAIGTAMMLGLRALAGAADGGPASQSAAIGADWVPIALYVWTYASSVMAHAVFFDLASSAVTGGLGMGVVVLALARALRARTRGPVHVPR